MRGGGGSDLSTEHIVCLKAAYFEVRAYLRVEWLAALSTLSAYTPACLRCGVYLRG